MDSKWGPYRCEAGRWKQSSYSPKHVDNTNGPEKDGQNLTVINTSLVTIAENVNGFDLGESALANPRKTLLYGENGPLEPEEHKTARNC